MSGSSLIGIQRVLIGVKYRNYCCTLDVYLLFAIWMGQIQLKQLLIYMLITYIMDWPVCKLQVCNLVSIIEITSESKKPRQI